MNKIFAFTLGFLFVFFSISFGQTYSKEFGKIGNASIELKEYPLDKDAEAVVIFDKGKSYFLREINTFNIIFERTTRIKILSESGIKWAEVEIPFYQEDNIYETVYNIEATSYNFNEGRLNKSQLDPSNTFDEKKNENWNIKKFAVPNVKVGSIIEYRYKIKSQYIFQLRDWEFQWRIPVVYSEYEVKMIPFYEYSFLLQSANRFDSQTSHVDKGLARQFGPVSFKDMVHKYVMKDIPAFESEEFITSVNDYIIKIDFQLSKINYPDGITKGIITTWEEMNLALLKHHDFGKYIQRSEKQAKKVLNFESLASKNDKEKFDYVLNYAKNTFSWNKENAKYASKNPKNLVDEKHGNCADINLFIIGLLNAVGLEAYPVLISTRNHGKIKYDYPYSHFFNYVIILAKVQGKNVLTDGTEIFSLNNRIPSRCINENGLIVQKNKVEWVNLESGYPSSMNTNINSVIQSDGTVNSSISKTASEYDALHYRKNYGDNKETIRENIESNDYNILDSTIIVQNQFEKEKPYVLSYNQTSKPEIINDKIYLSPFLDETMSDNPLKQKTRTYPVDMIYPKKRIFYSTIEVPDNYKVEYLPSDEKVNSQLVELAYITSFEGNHIFISFNYYLKKSVYSPTEYSRLKYYFDLITKKGNEKVVLSKNLDVEN